MFNPGGTGGTPPGEVVTDFGGGGANAQAIAVQSDGKIVVAGYNVNSGTNSDGNSSFALARYKTDGSLDTANFNTAGSKPGTITTSFGGGTTASVQSLLINSTSGAIDAAGYFLNELSSAFTYQIAVAQYTAAGALDASFNPSSITKGQIVTAYLSGSTALQGWGQAIAAIDPTHFMVAGGATDSSGNYFLAAAKYDPPLPLGGGASHSRVAPTLAGNPAGIVAIAGMRMDSAAGVTVPAFDPVMPGTGNVSDAAVNPVNPGPTRQPRALADETESDANLADPDEMPERIPPAEGGPDIISRGGGSEGMIAVSGDVEQSPADPWPRQAIGDHAGSLAKDPDLLALYYANGGPGTDDGGVTDEEAFAGCLASVGEDPDGTHRDAYFVRAVRTLPEGTDGE
jgi:hypothetical protein